MITFLKYYEFNPPHCEALYCLASIIPNMASLSTGYRPLTGRGDQTKQLIRERYAPSSAHW